MLCVQVHTLKARCVQVNYAMCAGAHPEGPAGPGAAPPPAVLHQVGEDGRGHPRHPLHPGHVPVDHRPRLQPGPPAAGA